MLSKCVPKYCTVHTLRYYNILTLTLFDLIHDISKKRDYRILTTYVVPEKGLGTGFITVNSVDEGWLM